MSYYKVASFNISNKVLVMTLFIVSLVSSVGYSQEKDINRLIQELKDEDSIVRSLAATALGEIKDARAVEPLIAALKNENSRVRKMVAAALGEMGSPAVEPLIAALKDEDRWVRAWAAAALSEINTPEALEALGISGADKELGTIAEYYSSFIRKGEADAQYFLIMALHKYGSVKMAEDFLNCGNLLLGNAASKWAKEHGYQIWPSFGRHASPMWGSRR